MVLVPYIQLGRLQVDVDETTHDQTPAAFNGMAEQGRVLYATNGCVYCHSQQVHSRAESADIDRGWGERRTVARDYLRDRAPYLGNSRLGGDLANVGTRRDKADWLYEHMYEPAVVDARLDLPAAALPLRPPQDCRSAVHPGRQGPGAGRPRRALWRRSSRRTMPRRSPPICSRSSVVVTNWPKPPRKRPKLPKLLFHFLLIWRRTQ